MIKAMVIVAACFAGIAESRLKEWTAAEYPNPQTDPVKCGRSNKPSYVCDPNKLISSADADMLDHILLPFSNNTKCACSQHECDTSNVKRGFLMAVALVKKLKGSSGDPESLEARKGLTRSFAFNVLKRHWAYGKVCDEATLIVFSQDDGILMTLPGSSPGRYLTHEIVLRIERAMARFFRDGNIGQGLQYLVLNYRRVLDGEYYNTVLFTDIASAASIMPTSILTSLIVSVFMVWVC